MSLKTHKYARKGKKEKLLKVLRRCSDVDHMDEDGKTALYYAMSEGHLKCVDILIEHGADPSR